MRPKYGGGIRQVGLRGGIIAPATWRKLEPFLDATTFVTSIAPALAGWLGVPVPEVMAAFPVISLAARAYARAARLEELYPTQKGEPFVYLGVDEFGLPLRISLKALLQHILLLGTTGSGKTTTLRALAYLPIHFGGGLTFVDGKADITDTYKPFYALAHAAGREKDFLVLNFLDPLQSNSWNPLIDKGADSDFCVQVVSGLLPEVSGDQQYWRDRGMALMRAIMACLVYKRDAYGKLFDIWDVRRAMSFNNAMDLLEEVIQGKIPLRDRRSGAPIGEYLIAYFDELGPWQEALAARRRLKQGGGGGPQKSDKRLEQLEVQHNYASQQWTDVLGLLGGTYAPIFAVKDPDIRMSDVITNSRILYVLLPSLGKAKDTLEKMGRMVLSAVRMSLFQLLGKRAVGSIEDVEKEIRANRPLYYHLGIFDEFGSYMVSGFSDVVAQARSLGYAAVFSGQELGRFFKKDEGEAKALMANTNIKIIAKTVDTDTSKVVVELAGEDWYLVPSSFKKEVGIIDRVTPSKEMRYEKRNVIDIIDLAALPIGHAYFFYPGQMRKGVVPYVKPEKPPKFLQILKPFPLEEGIRLLRKNEPVVLDKKRKYRIEKLVEEGVEQIESQEPQTVAGKVAKDAEKIAEKVKAEDKKAVATQKEGKKKMTPAELARRVMARIKKEDGFLLPVSATELEKLIETLGVDLGEEFYEVFLKEKPIEVRKKLVEALQSEFFQDKKLRDDYIVDYLNERLSHKAKEINKSSLQDAEFRKGLVEGLEKLVNGKLQKAA